jgi:signal transduction histidine kinase
VTIRPETPDSVDTVKERVRQALVDAWPSLPFLLVGIFGTQSAATYQPEARPPDVLCYVLTFAAALSLATRRRPELTLALTGTFVAGYVAVGYPFGPVLLTILPAAYWLADKRPPGRAALPTLTAFAVIVAASAVKRAREPGVENAVGDLFWTTVVWGAILAAVFALGVAVRARREGTAGVRSEQARRVASEERLRMAQDLHDSIGHGLAVIAMQAGVALHVLDRSPEEARAAMEAVRATSRESLDNLRAELEELRSPGQADRRPAPGLGDLERLTDRVRAGGIRVDVAIDPDLPSLPSPVDTTAYRVLQESLTNVLRHADATAATIRVGWENGTLLLAVTDTGQPKKPSNGKGSGIRGMRAQVEALGGTLTAGPRPAGGFAVEARLPVVAP